MIEQTENPKQRIFLVHEFNGSYEEAAAFIRENGNPLHADIDFQEDDDQNPYLPMILGYGEADEENLKIGDYLVIKEDRNTYAYTRAEVQAALILLNEQPG